MHTCFVNLIALSNLHYHPVLYNSDCTYLCSDVCCQVWQQIVYKHNLIMHMMSCTTFIPLPYGLFVIACICIQILTNNHSLELPLIAGKWNRPYQG